MDGKEAHFLMYRIAEEEVAVNAILKDESIWLNQKGMAELFDDYIVHKPPSEKRF